MHANVVCIVYMYMLHVAEGSGAGPEIDGNHSSKELQCQPPRTARGRTVSKSKFEYMCE